MVNWTTELEGEILSCLQQTGITTPAEIGRRLRISEAAAASLITLLVREGKVRMCLVELTEWEPTSRVPNGITARPELA